ncbi:endonuclease/exonuclease/phosphatase family protein [Nocardioides sp. LS1]|uniref:endonuclease/exonuclease/phosphatase family protein n=1 Tax=Nocardioides sp. LS1 TaxID=1027620 RepID=UPI000F61C1C5|nr:endonuclease/exonuclease/phosphatase family protein [Nocardioides sp. LS1]GCD92340.1 metal-dependent hydrolase [Nocardioides sp. LS1]
MNRWIHGLFALLALVTLGGLVAFWPAPARTPDPAPVPSSPVLPTSPPTPHPTPPTTPEPGACPTPGPAVRLSVLTFNIHGGLGHGRLDLGQIARAISVSRADVVLLQEVDRDRVRTGVVQQAESLGRTLGFHAAYGANKLRRPARPGLPPAAIGNAILSRYPITDVTNTHLPNRMGMELRGLLHARIDVRGRSVSVYNTHLQHTSGSMRREQAHAIREVIDRDAGPFILGGDLNAEPDSHAVAILERGGLADTWAEVGEGPGLTVPAFVPHRRIDFLLHDEAVRPLAAAVLRSGISDHREVWGAFEVPAAPPC